MIAESLEGQHQCDLGGRFVFGCTGSCMVLAGRDKLNASKDVGRWWDGTQRKMLVDIVVTADEARGFVCNKFIALHGTLTM